MKSFFFAAALALASSFAVAGNYSAYGTVGTQGIGGGVAIPISEATNARVEVNTINLSADFTEDNVKYNAKVKNNSIAAMYDWHFTSALPGLRLTTGVVLNDGGVEGTGTSTTTGSYTFNNTTYVVGANESVQVRANLKKVAPYIGLGFANMTKQKGISFFADAGAFYATPTAQVTLSSGLKSVVSAADLAAETAKVQDHLDTLKWYPVVRVGLNYAF